jgi:hypothetical protein
MALGDLSCFLHHHQKSFQERYEGPCQDGLLPISGDIPWQSRVLFSVLSVLMVGGFPERISYFP